MIIFIYILFFNCKFSSGSSNTFVFSANSNTYIAFDSWRPCLTGYIRFDIRTTAQDGTLAYIDDRGKFDFFYLKLIQGKLRLLFNLGNDRQAINVNMKINDEKWHTVLIQRNGQITILNIDNGLAVNSTITHSEDLYFGGATHNEYDASPFYFGGIPSILERPSSGNLSSFDVYMQARFRGQLRNLIYKNCTDTRLIQPHSREISGGISLIPNPFCSEKLCGLGICLINETNSKCLCDETDYQGKYCQYERKTNDLVFDNKYYIKYNFPQIIQSLNEILTFQFKTNQYNGLLFQLIDSQFYIKLKQGLIILEYRLNNTWYELSTIKDLNLIDNQWHYVQIKRTTEQLTIIIDQYYLHLDTDIKINQLWDFQQIFIGGNQDLNIPKFYGCLKDISIIFNENLTIHINQSSSSIESSLIRSSKTCKSLINPIQFLTSSSYLLVEHRNLSQNFNISFRFETYSSDCILLYSQSNQDFLGLDLIDGFFSITINLNKRKQRQELFQQRLNDGQTHFIQLEFKTYTIGFELNVTMDYRQNNRIIIRNSSSKINLNTITIGGVNPMTRWLPTNYYSGIMRRGLIGCFSNLEINNELINLTKYINSSNNISPRSGPCSVLLSRKRECLCEHDGECRLNNGGLWSCDCSKTGYTGRRCEQIAYHLDLNQIQSFELNTNIQWSDQINNIAFGLQAMHDEENFFEIRSCRLSLKCDSIQFSIRNGLLNIQFYSINLTIEYPFLLDNQWHSIDLQRINKNFLLHIDNHIIQQRIQLNSTNSSLYSTIWIVFNGNKQVLIEDLRLYDQSIYSNFFLHNQNEQLKLKTRAWKPLNTISFNNDQNSYLEIQLNEILCQDCSLNSMYFQFRTTQSNGLLLFANVKTNMNSLTEYFLLKLINGYVYLLIIDQSFHELYQISTRILVNNNQWHHLSFNRASDYHIELIIDSYEYYLSISVNFFDKIVFGYSLGNHLSIIKTCFSSLTINSQTINLREYIKTNSQIHNQCFLESQCPLKHCLNTGICQERIQCNCQHTSFQGKYCQNLKLGYKFNNHTPGLIFDQPFYKEKMFFIYQISFGIITKMNNSDIIRINDQIYIDLYYGIIRVKLVGNDYIYNYQIINDGFYHVIQMKYNITGYLDLYVDNKGVRKQINKKILFDKPLLLLIGQNPAFKHPFQGELYGLESDIYSIFDLISPTFQRITLAPIRNQTYFSSFSPAIIYPDNQISNNNTSSSCSHQPHDEICIIPSDSNFSLLSYPNITLQSLSIFPTTKRFLLTTTSYKQLAFSLSNSTDFYDIPPGILLPDVTENNQQTGKFYWKDISIIIIAVLCGISICIICLICACMKYRRKDAGVYELVETQRFRPLIVEVPSTPGENHRQTNSTGKTQTRKSNLFSQKRKKTPLLRFDEQREFYI